MISPVVACAEAVPASATLNASADRKTNDPLRNLFMGKLPLTECPGRCVSGLNSDSFAMQERQQGIFR